MTELTCVDCKHSELKETYIGTYDLVVLFCNYEKDYVENLSICDYYKE